MILCCNTKLLNACISLRINKLSFYLSISISNCLKMMFSIERPLWGQDGYGLVIDSVLKSVLQGIV